MKLADISAHRDIVLVSGRLCSGKGHFCTVNYPNHYHLPVSTVVKTLANTQVRSELNKTADLDKQIVQELVRQINDHPKIVIDGIRQISIIKALQQQFGDDIKDIIWLDVPDSVRRERFFARSSTKDDVSFDQASLGDEALGINDVENHARRVGRVSPN